MLFLATALQAGILWRFGRPLVERLDDAARSVLELVASLIALVVAVIAVFGEAQALYKLTSVGLLGISGAWPVYLALWTVGLGILLLVVLAQVRIAARSRLGRPAYAHLVFAGGFLSAYVVLAIVDIAT